MKRLLLTAIFLGAVSIVPLFARPADHFPPDDFSSGWRGAEVQRIRTASELFDYMDGGAELYLEYRFKELQVREYHHENLGDIAIEIYRFGSPDDAFGIYSLDTSGTAINLGAGMVASTSAGGAALRFRKDVYFVRLFSWQFQPDLSPVLQTAARLTGEKLADTGQLSGWLTSLTGIGSTAFVRGEIALRQVAGSWLPESVSIDRECGAVWLQLEAPPVNASCLALSYPDSIRSQQAFHDVWSHLIDPTGKSVLAGQRGLVRQFEVSVVGLEKYRTFLLWVLHSANESECAQALEIIKTALGGDKE